MGRRDTLQLKTITMPCSVLLLLVLEMRYCLNSQLVNIMSVNSILAHCNIIHSSYMRGVQAPVVYTFFANAAPEQKILEAPNNLIYLPVTVDIISTLSVWLTDQHGKPMDLRGEELTIRFHLRER